jgi:hypothetical protein
MMKKLPLFLVVAYLLAMIIASPTAVAAASSNLGAWVPYPYASASLAACGADCIGVARGSGSSMVFFDIHRSAWTELDFGAVQTVRTLMADGHTVFAYTDDLLIGYSALTSEYHTTPYNGTLLKPGYPNPSYGCGRNLAFFVTTDAIYVYDAELGVWQAYDYGLPVDFSGYSTYTVKDDYVWVVLYRGLHSEKQPTNVVYSLHTHSFNQLEYGCWDAYAVLDHGFARWHEHSVENYTLVGYSAYTNAFDVVPVVGQGILCFSNVVASGLVGLIDAITAYAVSFRRVVEEDMVRVAYYGFDTRLGDWSHALTVDFDPLVERYVLGSWQHGGQFVLDMAIYEDSEAYDFFIYSGLTGAISRISPGIVYHSATSGTPRGGTVMVAYDTTAAWGYDVAAGRGSMIALGDPNTVGFPVCGEDFCVFYRNSDASKNMTMVVYNRRTNSWTTCTLPKQLSGEHSSNAHVYVFNTYSPTRETVFYSAFTDAYVTCAFPADSFVSQRIGATLAWASSSNRSFLFDAQTGALHAFDFEFRQNGLGDFAAAFNDGDTLYGYSALSGRWTELTITDTPYFCLTTGHIGLISSNTGPTYYTKFYAYNGLRDSWVELIPAGSYNDHRVGEQTAVVMRSTMLYAFDPDGLTYAVDVGGSSYPISVVTNSTITHFAFSQSSKTISVNVTGDPRTAGFCNLTFPTPLLGAPYTVLVDDAPVTPGVSSNTTHTTLSVTYPHSDHMVEIIGTTVIPEFPVVIAPLLSLGCLTFFLLLTTNRGRHRRGVRTGIR